MSDLEQKYDLVICDDLEDSEHEEAYYETLKKWYNEPQFQPLKRSNRIMFQGNPEPLDAVRVAISSYAKFSDDDVQAATMKLLRSIETDLSEREYEPSEGTEELVASVVTALDEADDKSADDLDEDD